MESLHQQLMSDEWLSPIAFILFGFIGLFWFRLMKLFSRQFLHKHARHPLFRTAYMRFESRTRLSWILIGFGLLWLGQTVVEKGVSSKTFQVTIAR